ncbi:hypothetical protein A2982_03875 [candidate division WWE3 bacterium RIFCSPLOWO2_01_FULL_39_13]|uniref:Uncharacterized protein n=1 Tax=candidate division WWE3 bacterium RIFCSPLOWO2_01_FULL_39_13 TaxID=1802624 RepID=A0A1F4V3V1_UNCKA|nr:MAG: hypothetical protein A2982_03875 [candidate division WWE3 bacterium RIFCSPLOWO2_01_FULL_39_13]
MQSFRQKLLSKINSLSPEDEVVFDRMFKVWTVKGELKIPKEMAPWVKKEFGSLEAVEKQIFIKAVNLITYEGTIFNDLRTKRPIVGDEKITEVMDLIETTQDERFANPLTGTPSDTFGRIEGKYCITASNLAKYDGLHSMLIFKDPNPLLFSRKRIKDYFDVARKWYVLAGRSNKRAVYPMFIWNCLWRAGASIVNGHTHMVLTEGQAYAKVEELRNLSHKYQELYRSGYFDDLYSIHKSLGLAFERKGVKVISKITPIKEKEVEIYADDDGEDFSDVVSDVLNTMKENLGVSSFNLSVVHRPMEKTAEVWDHMPVLVRIVDRGRLSSRTTDFAAMELYAQSVVGSNPYVVFDELKTALLGSHAKE